eukprot:1145806-Pelagomonas_calceolata.AAC.8
MRIGRVVAMPRDARTLLLLVSTSARPATPPPKAPSKQRACLVLMIVAQIDKRFNHVLIVNSASHTNQDDV